MWIVSTSGRRLRLRPRSRYARCARSHKASDAICTVVNVDAVQIIPQNYSWDGTAIALPVGIVHLQRRTQIRICPRLFVDDQQQIEAVEQEMRTANRRIEDAQIYDFWIHDLRLAPNSAIANRQSKIVNPSAASLSIIWYHSRPSVLSDEELDHVARGVELVAKG